MLLWLAMPPQLKGRGISTSRFWGPLCTLAFYVTVTAFFMLNKVGK